MVRCKTRYHLRHVAYGTNNPMHVMESVSRAQAALANDLSSWALIDADWRSIA